METYSAKFRYKKELRNDKPAMQGVCGNCEKKFSALSVANRP
jgi:hypothetical protein